MALVPPSTENPKICRTLLSDMGSSTGEIAEKPTDMVQRLVRSDEHR